MFSFFHLNYLTMKNNNHNVFNSKIIAIGIFSFLMMISTVSTSEAKLWELLIEVDVENRSIYPNETVKIKGKVVDHAYNPIRGAEVLIRTGGDTTKAFTDPSGVFVGELKGMERIPGTYKVDVVATWYGKTGLTNTEFLVKGESSHVSDLERKLPLLSPIFCRPSTLCSDSWLWTTADLKQVKFVFA